MESAVTKVWVEIMEETCRFLEDLAQTRGWTLQEALRIAIAEGISSLRAGETSNKMDGLSDSEKVIRLLGMLKDADADYAALKFQNYQLSRDNKTLEMNVSGYKSKVESLEAYLGELKEKLVRYKEQQRDLPVD